MSEFQRISSCPTCGKPLPCILHDRRTREAMLAPEIERPSMEKLRSWEWNRGRYGGLAMHAMVGGKALVYGDDSEQMSLLDLKSGKKEDVGTLDVSPSSLGTIALPTGGFLLYGKDYDHPAMVAVDASGRSSGNILQKFTDALEVPVYAASSAVEMGFGAAEEHTKMTKGTSKSKRPFRPSHMDVSGIDLFRRGDYRMDQLDAMVGVSADRGLAFVGTWEVSLWDDEEIAKDPVEESQRLFALDLKSDPPASREIGIVPEPAVDSAFALPDGRLLAVSLAEVRILDARLEGTVLAEPIIVAGEDERVNVQQIAPAEWICLVMDKYANTIISRGRISYADGKLTTRDFLSGNLDEVASITVMDNKHSLGSSGTQLVRVDMTVDPPDVVPLEVPRVENWIRSIVSVGNGQALVSSYDRNGMNFIELWGVPEDKMRAYHESMVAAEDEEIPELPFV